MPNTSAFTNKGNKNVSNFLVFFPKNYQKRVKFMKFDRQKFLVFVFVSKPTKIMFYLHKKAYNAP